MSRPRFLSSFSESNSEKAKHVQEKIRMSVDYAQEARQKPLCFILEFSFFLHVLPPLHLFPQEFQDLLKWSLFDQDMKEDLERARILNWCRNARKLYPIKTQNDGNCLLHALSVAIWGVPDSLLIFRRLLSAAMSSECKKLKQRWQHHRRLQDQQMLGKTLEYTSGDWNTEWNQIVLSAGGDRAPASSTAMPYVHLEAIHVYTLANILRRPIIILADNTIRTFSGSSLQENDLGGIYLPLEWDPNECWRIPVVLGYSMNHFCPLLGTDNQADDASRSAGAENVIPLVYENSSSLPVRFLSQTEERNVADLLEKYLKLKEIHVSGTSAVPILAAVIEYNPIQDNLNVVQDYHSNCERKYWDYIDREFVPVTSVEHTRSPRRQQQLLVGGPVPVRDVPEDIPVFQSSRCEIQTGTAEMMPNNDFQLTPCKTPGCDMYGTPANGNMCTKCMDSFLQEAAARERRMPKVDPIQPSAPPPSMPQGEEYTEMSMMGESCIRRCGYRCSVKTHPYCHECAEKVRIEMVRKVHETNLVPSSSPQARLPMSSETAIPENLLFGTGEQPRIPSGVPMQESGGYEDETLARQTQNKSLVQKTRCITPGCNGIANMLRQNRCTKCYIENSGSLPIDPPTTTHSSLLGLLSPAVVSVSTGKESPFVKFQKCKTEECSSPGLSENNGLCAACATRYAQIKQHQGTSETQDLMTNASGGMSLPPAISEPVRKYICSKPGCVGVRLDNSLGQCWSCFIRSNNASQHISGTASVGIAEMAQPSEGMDDLLESGTPSNAHSIKREILTGPEQKQPCASPMCETMVYPPVKLCERCMDILRKNQAEETKAQANPPAHQRIQESQSQTQELKTKCKYPGCSFHGSPSFGGYCSVCAKAFQVGNMPFTGNHSAPIAVRNPVIAGLSVNRPATAPHGKRCQTAGCSKYGDPNMRDLCTTCYHFYLQSQRRSLPCHSVEKTERVHLVQGEKGSPSRQTSFPGACGPPVDSQNDNFTAMMAKVENRQKNPRLCKMMHCQNYGNTASEGFCNSCYPKYIQSTQSSYVGGEDRCG